ncbi:MAG: hypothetical protein AAB446_02260 [Patescibacteria group bacterium]
MVDVEKELDKTLHERLLLDSCRASISNFVHCGSFVNAKEFLDKLEEKVSSMKSELEGDNQERTITDEYEDALDRDFEFMQGH